MQSSKHKAKLSSPPNPHPSPQLWQALTVEQTLFCRVCLRRIIIPWPIDMHVCWQYYKAHKQFGQFQLTASSNNSHNDDGPDEQRTRVIIVAIRARPSGNGSRLTPNAMMDDDGQPVLWPLLGLYWPLIERRTMHKGATGERARQRSSWRSRSSNNAIYYGKTSARQAQIGSQMRRFETPSEHEATGLAITRGVPQAHKYTHTDTRTHTFMLTFTNCHGIV